MKILIKKGDCFYVKCVPYNFHQKHQSITYFYYPLMALITEILRPLQNI